MVDVELKTVTPTKVRKKAAEKRPKAKVVVIEDEDMRR